MSIFVLSYFLSIPSRLTQQLFTSFLQSNLSYIHILGMAPSSTTSSQHGVGESGASRRTNRRLTGEQPEHDVHALDRITADLRGQQKQQRKLLAGQITLAPLHKSETNQVFSEMLLGIGEYKRGRTNNQIEFGERGHSKSNDSEDKDLPLTTPIPPSPVLVGSDDRSDGRRGPSSESDSERDHSQPGKFFPARSSSPTQSLKSEDRQADVTVIASSHLTSSLYPNLPIPPPASTLACPIRPAEPSTVPVQGGSSILRHPGVSPPMGDGEGDQGRGTVASSHHERQRSMASTGEGRDPSRRHLAQAALLGDATGGGGPLEPVQMGPRPLHDGDRRSKAPPPSRKTSPPLAFPRRGKWKKFQYPLS